LVQKPLKILFHISVNLVYPAQFSADSQSLIIVSRALTFARWRLPDGEKTAAAELPGKEECLDGQLSPGGVFFACTRPDYHLVLYDVSTQASIAESSTAPFVAPLPGGRYLGPPVISMFFSLLDSNTAFAGPFGLIRTSKPRPNASHSLSSSFIHFSPDAGTLVANLLGASFGLDVKAKKKFELPSAVEKATKGAIALQSSDRVVAIEKEKGKEKADTVSIFSLKDGKVLPPPAFTASRIHIPTNPHLAILYTFGPDGRTTGVFDLGQLRAVDIPPALSLDIQGDEMAVYNLNGSIALYRLGEHNLLASLPLPLSALPVLRSAAASPDLEKLAVSVDGAGAIFQVLNGLRVASFPKSSAMNFLDQQEASLFLPRNYEIPARISRINLSNGIASPSWELGKEQELRAGGPVLLEYSRERLMMDTHWGSSVLDLQSPYRLRSIDPASGKELWKRDFNDNPPTPFADPQGERFVLGWKAKSPEAKDAASHFPAAHDIYKKAKLTDQDSYFEALDARSGKSLGGILVQAGNGAVSFEAAFSVGDAMILLKDGVRVSIYSVSDGQLKARLVGLKPTASSRTNLLALELGPGRLAIHDLSSGAKLDEELFPEAIAYLHFSEDGKRLLVLTQHQGVAILDVSKAREAEGASP
jgi:hypothetical protein